MNRKEYRETYERFENIKLKALDVISIMQEIGLRETKGIDSDDFAGIDLQPENVVVNFFVLDNDHDSSTYEQTTLRSVSIPANYMTITQDQAREDIYRELNMYADTWMKLQEYEEKYGNDVLKNFIRKNS